ncbi:MAG: formate dehydrogenase subunit delta [Actinomycetales bacterium]|nr:formate dehydrogenase subunit delta [Actinomycetales bacterium]MCP4892870.1 formate dehydrogenase subunit delta [Actinomycetales bacterium]
MSEAKPALTYEDEHLIAMAHQIAANMPVDRDVSERMATHLRTFWTPVMRDRLGMLAMEHPNMVSDDVREAVARANEGVRR